MLAVNSVSVFFLFLTTQLSKHREHVVAAQACPHSTVCHQCEPVIITVIIKICICITMQRWLDRQRRWKRCRAASIQEECVSIKSSLKCESCLFCLFSTVQKVGVNSQPLTFSISKAAWQQQQKMSLHGVKHFCRLMALGSIASVSLSLHACGYTSSLFLLSWFSPLPLPPTVLPPYCYMDTYLKNDCPCDIIIHAAVSVGPSKC